MTSSNVPRRRGRPPTVSLGERYGRLTVIEDAGTIGTNRAWLCRCDCGNETIVPSHRLKGGDTRSCGCLRREHARANGVESRTHGHKLNGLPSPTYNSWRSMLARCLNPNATGWSGYGGRGIMVCDRWQGAMGFERFLDDMGVRPEGTSLGRFGDVGNYEPGNCAWQTQEEQVAEATKKRARRKAS